MRCGCCVGHTWRLLPRPLAACVAALQARIARHGSASPIGCGSEREADTAPAHHPPTACAHTHARHATHTPRRAPPRSRTVYARVCMHSDGGACHWRIHRRWCICIHRRWRRVWHRHWSGLPSWWCRGPCHWWPMSLVGGPPVHVHSCSCPQYTAVPPAAWVHRRAHVYTCTSSGMGASPRTCMYLHGMMLHTPSRSRCHGHCHCHCHGHIRSTCTRHLQHLQHLQHP